MTKRHFEQIAAVLRAHRALAETKESGGELAAHLLPAYAAVRETCDSIARSLADAFPDFNANFDRARFLEACGTEDE